MLTTKDRHNFPDIEAQSQYLAQQVASILADAISVRKKAYLAVSGGSTPKVFFNHLSNIDLPWHIVTITLVDDRWVAPTHNDSNQKLVMDNLLINKAQSAEFINLYSKDSSPAEAVNQLNIRFNCAETVFDALLLGMGNDGHTASLFPCSKQLADGLSTPATYLVTEPTTAPYTRISLSAQAISQARHIFLQLKGQDKQETLEKALSKTDENSMPIRRFLKDTTVLWCP